jgi:hypothetical protein
MHNELHEDRSIKPLLDNAIVEGNGTRWKTERWRCADNKHYYNFIDVGETGYRDAQKKPSGVVKALQSGKLKIINLGIPDDVFAPIHEIIGGMSMLDYQEKKMQQSEQNKAK